MLLLTFPLFIGTVLVAVSAMADSLLVLYAGRIITGEFPLKVSLPFIDKTHVAAFVRPNLNQLLHAES